MCGIFGIIAKKNSQYNLDSLKNTLKKIALLSESRGKDSSGLAFRNEINRSIDVFKGPIPISELLKSDEINKEFNSY